LEKKIEFFYSCRTACVITIVKYDNLVVFLVVVVVVVVAYVTFSTKSREGRLLNISSSLQNQVSE